VRQVAILALGVVLLELSAAWTQPDAHRSAPRQVAYGAGSMIGTLVYVPVKAGFCVLGAIGGGLTFPLTGPRTAGRVADSACGGTWIITPAALEGRVPVKFVDGTS
jgi:hypothetical protein